MQSQEIQEKQKSLADNIVGRLLDLQLEDKLSQDQISTICKTVETLVNDHGTVKVEISQENITALVDAFNKPRKRLSELIESIVGEVKSYENKEDVIVPLLHILAVITLQK